MGLCSRLKTIYLDGNHLDRLVFDPECECQANILAQRRDSQSIFEDVVVGNQVIIGENLIHGIRRIGILELFDSLNDQKAKICKGKPRLGMKILS